MRDPDLATELGHAWKVTKQGPEWAACLSFWFMNIPSHHPMLQWFVLGMSHLRDVPGAPVANKYDKDCTHEMFIAAIDPEPYLFNNIDPDDDRRFKLLLPIEIEHQFRKITDHSAIVIADTAVAMILSGFKPDREYRQDWLRMLNKWQSESRIN